jgi:hypothetical protein
MSTPNTCLTYPFDPTGSLVSNLITGEQQQLVAQNFRNQHFIVPKAAPFFADTLSIQYQDTQGNVSTLQEGVHYYVTHWFISASRACAMRVYGSITFIDTALAGIVSLTYQTVGGQWTIAAQQIATIMADVVDNPRITSWEEVSGTPYAFPPEAHAWDVNDMVGMDAVVTAIGTITTALQSTGSTGLAAHIANHNNPHVVTASQVGLGLVQNYAMAGNSDAVAGTSTTLYMSPATTAAAIQSLASGPLTAHINNHNNPHQVTASQVGLGNVANYAPAQNTDAQAGTSTTLYMTPATTMVAINSSVGNALQAHILNTSNPHAVTAAQVGLGNVANFGVAQNADAVAGTANNLYMTPAATAAAIANQGSNAVLNAHITNYSNPHQVTAAQVGTLTTAQINALLAGYLTTTGVAADSSLLTGLTVAQLTAQILSGTAANAAEFGGLTPAQWQAALQGGTASDSQMFGGMTPTQWDQYIANATVANALELNGLNVCQLTAQILSGTAANATLAYGETKAQLTADILAGTAANATTVYGLTQAQLTTAILAGTAANANAVYGLSQAQLTTAITNSVNNQTWTAGFATPQDTYPAATDTTDPFLWTKIAQMAMQGTTGQAHYPDLQLMVTGGDASTDTNSGAFFVRVSVRNTASPDLVGLQVLSLTGQNASTSKFGYTIDTSNANAPLLTVWMQTPGGANPITVNAVSQYNNNFISAISVVNAQPAGITYAVTDTFATVAELNNIVAQLTTAFATVVQAVSNASSTPPATTSTTFDPAYLNADMTLSNSNMSVTSSKSNVWRTELATYGRQSGKVYAEVQIDVLEGGVGFGIANANHVATNPLGAGTNSIMMFNQPSKALSGVQYNGAIAGSIGTQLPVAGSILGVAVDFGAAKAWFYNPATGQWNGDVLANQNPATGTGGYSIATILTPSGSNVNVYLAASIDEAGDMVTLNPGTEAFTNTIPSGFEAWNLSS